MARAVVLEAQMHMADQHAGEGLPLLVGVHRFSVEAHPFLAWDHPIWVEAHPFLVWVHRGQVHCKAVLQAEA